jgi:hypothetical protein
MAAASTYAACSRDGILLVNQTTMSGTAVVTIDRYVAAHTGRAPDRSSTSQYSGAKAGEMFRAEAQKRSGPPATEPTVSSLFTNCP